MFLFHVIISALLSPSSQVYLGKLNRTELNSNVQQKIPDFH